MLINNSMDSRNVQFIPTSRGCCHWLVVPSACAIGTSLWQHSSGHHKKQPRCPGGRLLITAGHPWADSTNIWRGSQNGEELAVCVEIQGVEEISIIVSNFLCINLLSVELSVLAVRDNLQSSNQNGHIWMLFHIIIRRLHACKCTKQCRIAYAGWLCIMYEVGNILFSVHRCFVVTFLRLCCWLLLREVLLWIIRNMNWRLISEAKCTFVVPLWLMP